MSSHKANGDQQYHMLNEQKFDICGQCGKLFSNRDLLIKHMETIHNSNIFNKYLYDILEEKRQERFMITGESASKIA